MSVSEAASCAKRANEKSLSIAVADVLPRPVLVLGDDAQRLLRLDAADG